MIREISCDSVKVKTMKEYLKLYWKHTSEKEANEPVIMIYEVDLLQNRYATRVIDVFDDGNVKNWEDKSWGVVTECAVDTVEEINSADDEYGKNFYACLMTKEEFEEIWNTHIYNGALDFPLN